MRQFFGFVAGALCGAVVGSVTALLLTPISGSDIKAQGRARVENIVTEMRLAYEGKQAELEAELEALKAQGAVES